MIFRVTPVLKDNDFDNTPDVGVSTGSIPQSYVEDRESDDEYMVNMVYMASFNRGMASRSDREADNRRRRERGFPRQDARMAHGTDSEANNRRQGLDFERHYRAFPPQDARTDRFRSDREADRFSDSEVRRRGC